MARITWAPEVIDGVLAAVRALDGYRAPTDTTDGITVYDGPEARFYGDLDGSYLIVGYGGEDELDPGDPSSEASAGDITIRTMASPSRPKANTDTLECLAVYQTGDFNVSAARTAVVTIGSQVDTALRNAPRVGTSTDSSGAQVIQVYVSSWSLRNYLRGTLLIAELRFTVTYSTHT